MGRALVVAAGCAAGCVMVERPFDAEFAAAGVVAVDARVGAGTFAYSGADTETITVAGESWAVGASEKRATDREFHNDFDVEVVGGVLTVTAATPKAQTGVNFDVVGPPTMRLEIQSTGTVALDAVTGTHAIDAWAIVGDVGGGGAFSVGDGGMDVTFTPLDPSETTISAEGDVTLALPEDLPYQLVVYTDEAGVIDVPEDFPFDLVDEGTGVFTGTTGEGTVRVTVTISGGGFTLRSAT